MLRSSNAGGKAARKGVYEHAGGALDGGVEYNGEKGKHEGTYTTRIKTRERRGKVDDAGGGVMHQPWKRHGGAWSQSCVRAPSCNDDNNDDTQ